MPPPEKEAGAGGFRFVGERERYRGGFISLTSGTFIDPSGFTFERDIVRHPGAVTIVPLTDDNEVLLVRQYRAPIDRELLEFPAGKLDVPGEELATAAARELAEEAGRRAERLSEIGQFYNSPGFTDEHTTCFLAEGLVVVDQSLQGIEEQHLTLEALSIEAFWKLVGAGVLVDAKSIIAMTLTERHLGERDGRHA